MRDKKRRPPDDELTRKLREAARKKPPLSLLGLLIVFICCGGPLTLLVWWVFPRPEPPTVAVAAFDDVAVEGGKVRLQAQVVEDISKQPLLHHGGLELVFAELQSGKPLRQVGVPIDDKGQAELFTRLETKSGAVKYLIRYAATRRSANDTATVFLWAADSAPLLVAIDTLTSADRRKTNPRHMQPLAGAGECLHMVKDRHIAYLVVDDDPWVYRRMRGWLELQFNAKHFPAGPVLGLPGYGGGGIDGIAHAADRLAKQFTGKATAVVGTAKVATAMRDLKLRTFLLGGADAIEGVTNVAIWKELGDLLANDR